jgi:hypothetical protein
LPPFRERRLSPNSVTLGRGAADFSRYGALLLHGGGDGCREAIRERVELGAAILSGAPFLLLLSVSELRHPLGVGF